MYWLRRPPFARWIAAGLIVCFGLYLDTRPQAVELYPFASRDISVGETVQDSLEWRNVPAGALPTWDSEISGVAAVDITVGTPLLPELATDLATPTGWWEVSLPLPFRMAPGRHIRIALDDGTVDGLLVSEVADTGYELTGSVAFPANEASRVAAAAATHDALVVMIGSSDPSRDSNG